MVYFCHVRDQTKNQEIEATHNIEFNVICNQVLVELKSLQHCLLVSVSTTCVSDDALRYRRHSEFEWQTTCLLSGVYTISGIDTEILKQISLSTRVQMKLRLFDAEVVVLGAALS